MREYSRRDFLKTSALALALLAGSSMGLHPFRARAEDASIIGKKEFLLLSDTFEENPHRDAVIAVSKPGFVRVLDVGSGKVSSIDTPFFGHSLEQNPRQPTQVVTFEKWGRRGALIDFRERKILTTTEANKGNIFFGHSAFVQGDVVAVVEDTYKRSGGELSLRDPGTLKLIQKMSSYGNMPHQCRALDDGKTLIVINQGKKGISTPNLAWIEMTSGKLLNKVELFPTPAFAHLDISHDNWIVVGGRYAKNKTVGSRVALISPEGRLMRLEAPAELTSKMWDEALSVAFAGDTGLVGATYREGNYVALWDYKTQTFVAAMPAHYPTGILSDPKATSQRPSVLVSSHDDRNLLEVSLTRDHRLETHVISTAFGGTGSHLTRLYA